MPHKLLLILLLATLSTLAAGRYPDCNAIEYDTYFKIKTVCNNLGEITQVVKHLKSTKTLSNITTFREGKITSYKSWSSDGKNVVHNTYSHPEDGTTIATFFKPETDIITSQKQYIPKNDKPMKAKRDVKEWFYDSQKDYILYQVNEYIYFGEIRFTNYREVYREGSLYRSYLFNYSLENPEPKHPLSYEEFGTNGEFITKYRPSDFSLDEYLDQYGDIPNRKYNIAIIDSEFDVSHPMLAGYLYLNPKEKLDGINQDMNAWIDDVMGWNHETGSNILLSPILLQATGCPASHGTHVASLALRGHENFSLVGYAGDMTNVEHLQNIMKDIQLKRIPFTNMSFGFNNTHSAFSPGEEPIRAIGKLIRQTPNTLHVIAAGNSGHEIDSYGLHNYPASYGMENILVVAALNTDHLDMEMIDSYELADFTNFGKQNVDIAAPGTMLKGAAPGGGIIRYSGTSMASPYTLNHGVMRAYEINPKLTALQIKEIIIKSAYIKDLDNPMPVCSGGILYPKRVEAVATLLKLKPELSVTRAVLSVRANENYSLPGEFAGEEYLTKLVTFWESRTALAK